MSQGSGFGRSQIITRASLAGHWATTTRPDPLPCDMERQMEIRKLSNVSNELVSMSQSPSLSTISSDASLSELTALAPEDTVVLGDVVIHRSDNGLYNLNDLHKAAGGSDSLRPAKFFEVAKHQAYISTLQAATPNDPVVKTVRGGSNPGTWGSEEVAYKYASWISDDFDVLVMSTFKKVVRKELEWVTKARLAAIEAHGEEKASHIKTLGQLQAAQKENKDSMLIIRTMEQGISRLENNVPKTVGDYIGLQKANTIAATFAIENAHGALLAIYDDADSIIHGIKVKLNQDMTNHWRNFLTNEVLNPLQEVSAQAKTKLGEVSDDLRKAKNFRTGGNKHFGKQES